MKHLKYLILFSVVVITTFTACQEEPQPVEMPQTQLSEIEEGVLTFLDVSQGDEVLFIYHTQNSIDWEVLIISDSSTLQKNQSIDFFEHDFESTNKYSLARWADQQIQNGKCVKVGKTGDTYWGDIVAC
ncbi:MAG: hypothetical protein HC880_12205 [Bacteroidia bacterium]|nr:hypothetical protein [Bacteroidia bacterium]